MTPTSDRPRKYLPRPDFWTHVFEWDGSGEHMVTLTVLSFGVYASLIWFIDWITGVDMDLGLSIAPYEYTGAILGSLLVLRTNAGLDRWYEARKLWGGIINESRNLGIIAVANGPEDREWRREILGWIASFGHVTRQSLRRQKDLSEIHDLVGTEGVARVAASEHRPTAVSLMISTLLRKARDQGLIDSSAFLRAEEQRCLLVDHLGGCERIEKTPLATAYVVLIRRFVVLFMVTLPFALLRRVEWLTPIITILVAYPVLALDHIAGDLERPFSTRSINHLPLNDITTTIETNLMAMVGGPIEDKPSVASEPAETAA